MPRNDLRTSKRMTARKKQGKAKRRAGRPSSYRPEYAAQAVKLCMVGATNDELARSFGVAASTVDLWIRDNAEFSGSVKNGREYADANVAASLYRRAIGYSHKAVKIFADVKTGQEKIVEYVEYYPPDSTACIFWLKNRRKEEWRDKQDHEHTGKDGDPIAITVTHVVVDPAGKPSAN